jgi:predicted ATPase
MHLRRLRIENFRALEKIDVEFESRVSVIIGPNAVGKTTVLEAIRLAKGLLAPRTPSESTQTLQALGAVSPHMPQRLFPAALTTKPNLPLVVKCTYEVTDEEIVKLQSLLPRLATSVAQQSVGLAFSAPAQAVAFLSSPMGQAAVAQARKSLDPEFARVQASRTIDLNLTIDFQSGQISGGDSIQQVMFSTLEQSLPPNSALFSYFPADRALPTGEQPVQLGMADTVNQLESYNSQPQLKYQRLKTAIFNSIISGDAGRSDLKKQFQLIFEQILRGRELGEIGVNELGMLSIPIKDTDSGAEFQVDGLSSGEKGLILTFLLIGQTVEQNGIILLDEPELHLNPAVCRHLLQFFVDEYSEKKKIQGIICSHSAELLAATFERPSCALYHLKDGTTLAKVRHQDQGEIRDALRRLGSSESEALLYRGTISVEGIHDVEVLQAGFDDLLRRYRIRHRGGREQIQKDIEELQKAEIRGDDIGNHYFIFDLDQKPTSLKESAHIRLLQLNRYCLENFLLDADILTDLSRDQQYSAAPKNTPTEMRDVMKALAMKQLDEFVARSVFKDMGLEAIGFDMDAAGAASAADIASAFHSQISTMMKAFQGLEQKGFDGEFVRKFGEKRKEWAGVWEEKWREKCNGKLLLEAMRRDGHFRGDLLRLKKAVITRMRTQKTETYSALRAMLGDLIGAPA